MDTFDTKKVSKIILLKKDRVLLLFSERLQKFQFPGGHLNVDETYIQALKRELFEETGLELSNYKLFFKKPDFVLYYGKPKPGTVKLSKEHSKYVWADVYDIHKYPLCKFTKRDIASFLKYKMPVKKSTTSIKSDIEDSET
jgi:8-oxo-dGTP pyrophosphatase MutT (NUDIX family)